MKKKTKKNSRILEAVYETASDLHVCGLLNEEQMQKYNELCLEPVTLYLDRDIIEYLNAKSLTTHESLQNLVNDLLHKEIKAELHSSSPN